MMSHSPYRNVNLMRIHVSGSVFANRLYVQGSEGGLNTTRVCIVWIILVLFIHMELFLSGREGKNYVDLIGRGRLRGEVHGMSSKLSKSSGSPWLSGTNEGNH